jgi:hypothetical protein
MLFDIRFQQSSCGMNMYSNHGLNPVAVSVRHGSSSPSTYGLHQRLVLASVCVMQFTAMMSMAVLAAAVVIRIHAHD